MPNPAHHGIAPPNIAADMVFGSIMATPFCTYLLLIHLVSRVGHYKAELWAGLGWL
ncbi:MAG: hypothetical protein MRQ10_03450 [Candidatus Midichloria mitochondrii]|nr:hypothetical protein [Candidatus Midichloria mitochondrii]